MDFDVIVLGNCFVDLVFGSVPRMPALGEEIYAQSFTVTGGGYFNAAVALARLGASVALLSTLGTDALSQWVRHELEREGVSTKLLFEVPGAARCVTAVASHADDRAFLSYKDQSQQPQFVHHAVQALSTHRARALHIAALPYVEPVLQVAHQQGMLISMDAAWDETWLSDPRLYTILGYAQVFVPNEQEARLITGARSPEQALRQLQALVSTVVVKLGGRGCVYLSTGQSTPRHVAALPAGSIVDTTGAGDNFDAGLLIGLLEQYNLDRCCHMANWCGAQSLHGLGGTASSPTRAALDAYLQTQEQQQHGPAQVMRKGTIQ